MWRFEELALRRLEVRAELHTLEGWVVNVALGSQPVYFPGSGPRTLSSRVFNLSTQRSRTTTLHLRPSQALSRLNPSHPT
jgi:hypothetical protein